jgi:hypothetical protein
MFYRSRSNYIGRLCTAIYGRFRRFSSGFREVFPCSGDAVGLMDILVHGWVVFIHVWRFLYSMDVFYVIVWQDLVIFDHFCQIFADFTVILRNYSRITAFLGFNSSRSRPFLVIFGHLWSVF